MDRKLESWLAGYIEYTRHLQSPLRFRTWAGLGAISAALQRKVHTRIQGQDQFANMYILLVGPPGVGKGNAMKRAAGLLRKDKKIKVAPQGITRRSFYAVLEGAMEISTDSHETIMQAPLTAFVEEFGIFVRPGDLEFMYTLADAFDNPPVFHYKTQTAGEHQIENICFTMVAACTPKILKQVMTEEALELGLGARIILIYSDEIIHVPLFAEEGRDDEGLYKDLVEDLKTIGKISGRYTYSKEAAEILTAWHAKGLAPIPSDSRFSHYNVRRLTQITKICMLMAASRSNDLVILPRDVEDARTLLLEAEQVMPKAIEMLGANPMLTQQQQAIQLINITWKKTKKGVPEFKLRQLFSRDISPQYVRALLDSLQHGRWLTVHGDEPDRIYFPRGMDTSSTEKSTQKKDDPPS